LQGLYNIIGQCDAPTFLENVEIVEIKAGSQLSGVIIGEGVTMGR